MKQGRLISPSGVEYTGFSITLGGITDPVSIERSYEDIEKILHQNKVEYKIHEEHKPDGTFKSYMVQT